VPVLTQAAAGAGSFSVVTDPDGIVRRLPDPASGRGYYPSLSLATASLYLNALAVKPLMTRNADELSQSRQRRLDYLTILLPGRKQRVIPVGEA
jgi:adenylate cyclase